MSENLEDNEPRIIPPAFFQQLNADDQYHDRNRQPRQVFVPCMAVRVLIIGRF